jgi:C4-dicarboxylate-specific signal transduction histidine kinase
VLLARQWLTRACGELLKNATDWLRGTPDPVITLSTRRRGLCVQIDCADNGPGLSPDQRRDVGWGTPPSRNGSGSGLFLMQAVLIQYEGLLSAPEPPRDSGGAILRISLPRVQNTVQ